MWAVDHDRAPDYWFPRQCPGAMVWITAQTTEQDRSASSAPAAGCGCMPYEWLEQMRTAKLRAYAHVAETEVAPLGPPERVGDLFGLYEEAGIQLKVLPALLPFWEHVITTTLGFSGIRLRNARPASLTAPPAP